MAAVEVAALTAPVSAEEPCGPDLEQGGDADFMHFLARAEGLLPVSFFDGEGRPFDRSGIDFKAECEAAMVLLARTRDVRLLVLLAKLAILNRDLDGFCSAIDATAALLQQHWEAVHPRGEGDDYSLRLASLASLDDLPTVVLPLQFLPLAQHRRFGAISVRQHLLASGQVRPRESEEAPDAGAIEQALAECDLSALVARRDQFERLGTALAAIGRVSSERAGSGQGAVLERLPALVERIVAFLDAAVARRDPSASRRARAREAAATGEAKEEPPAAPLAAQAALPGAVGSTAAAAAALAAVAAYFAAREPSNPAVLLVRQAEQLIGKSFPDVMRILMPALFEQAVVQIGSRPAIALPMGQLAEFAPREEEAVAQQDGAADPRAGSTMPTFKITTRREATALLEQVGAYYRTVEPSSPIPHLTDRARALVDRDFLALLKDFLPPEALPAREDGG